MVPDSVQGDAFVSLEAASVEFGTRTVLHEVSLKLAAGDCVALVGPSGAGKTTLLMLLAGLLEPSRGRLLVGSGRPSTAWVFQNSPVLARRSAIDNVLLGPALGGGMSDKDARQAAWLALETVGLTDLARQRAGDLSGGERQRVAIARALASGSELVLADEPTASLDALNRGAVCDALVATSQYGVAVVIATHDLAAAAKCDRVCRLDDGHVQVIEPRDLIDE